MRGAPRLLPAVRHGETGRQVVQVLADIPGLDAFLGMSPDLLAEGCGDLFLDHEDDLAETSPQRVIDGVSDNRLAAGADGIDLLQAAVTAADTGGHHD